MSYNYGLWPITVNFNISNNAFDIFSRMSVLHGEIAASHLIGRIKDRSSNEIPTFTNHKICDSILNIQIIIIISSSL